MNRDGADNGFLESTIAAVSMVDSGPIPGSEHQGTALQVLQTIMSLEGPKIFQVAV